MKDIHRAIYCELTGSEAQGQAMFNAWLIECLPAIPEVNLASLDKEISEEEYQASLIQIRKEMPYYRQSLLAYEPPPEVVEFWENQERKNREN